MKKIFVNGTFDVVHRGHIELLNYARTQGDYLTVAIDSDRRVKSLKGEDRPINNERDRSFLLASLKAVDQVIVFDSDLELIDLIKNHDLMVKGSDYKDKPIVGDNFINIIFYNIVDGYSTTKTIQNIINR
jgi:D-beta-D-heptose 7-phosphate kinase/D-beta-D-heptose 1-phosphate adenosyltransferase